MLTNNINRVVFAAMDTITDIFDAFGGAARVAAILNVGQSTASEMKRRESIPVEYWETLVAAAAENGVSDLTIELLHRVNAEAVAKRKAASRKPEPAE